MADIGFWEYSILITGTEVAFLTLLALYTHFSKAQHPNLYSVGVVTFFHAIVFLYAYNAPITDDNYALLEWGTDVLPNHSLANVVLKSFEPYNECRIVFARWLTAIDYYLFGSIDFRHLMMIGISGLWLILVLLIRQSTLPVLLIVLLLFQFQYYDSVFWANCSLQNIWAMAFSLLAIALTIKEYWHYRLLAIVTAIIATYTYGSGILVFPILALYLIWQKQYFHTVAVIIVFAGISLVYFKGFHSPKQPWDIISAIPFSLVFLGSSFQFLYNTTMPLIIGSSIAVCAVWMLVSGYHRKNPFIVMALLHIILCAFTAGLFRGTRGLEEGLSIRYGIYAIIGVICCITFLIETLKYNHATSTAIGFALLFHFAANFFFFPEVPIRYTLIKRYMQSIPNANITWYQSPVIPFEGRQIVKTAIGEGVYINPEVE